MRIITVLIVCGQGVYLRECGDFLTDHPADKEIYLEHALSVPSRARAVRATLVILSGGPTKRGAPGRTEGEGMRDLLEDFRTSFELECSPERCALDTGENVILGLLQARMLMPRDVAIGQIWLSSAWRFKKERIALTAQALGIPNRMYFSGFASEPAAGAKAVAGERDVVEYMKASGDALLLGRAFDEKRRRRYAGDVAYESRLADVRAAFPSVFEELDVLKENANARNSLDQTDFAPLQTAIRHEVLNPV